jgi:hypothetical protein
MRQASIAEFSLNVSLDYSRPVPFRDARLEDIATDFCASKFGAYAVPKEINLWNTNELFSYEMSIPIFNKVGSIIVNSQSLTVSIKQARTKENLELILDLIFEVVDIATLEQPIKHCSVSFGAHVLFQSAGDFEGWMERYTSLSEKVLSGGAVLSLKMPEIRSELRYTSEKSLVHPKGVFLSANTVTDAELKRDLFDYLGKQFEEAANLDDIRFSYSKT